ncbi:MAG: C4-type zinc ribbon domain-containing protein [Desulfobulbaceae bacterium]|nr:C4-type zinc ribbon domain-containing protein [Desulfobulbaceae bacterium]HIJ79444.1 hypothetical protein [Deltaproteobacteria bacterium]
MKEDINQLRELQEIDLKISKLTEEIAAGSADIDKRKLSIDAHKETIAKLNEKIAANEQRRQELDEELASEADRIKDRQAKLMNVQTNREYQSILKETEDAKKLNTQREESVVQLMEQIEAFKEKINEATNLCRGEEELLTEEMSKVGDQTAKLETEKLKISKARDTKAKKVNASLLKKYNVLREKRKGIAVIEVTSGVCRGCFMNIPPQLFNDLMREEKLLTCPTCNRIMFHQPAAEAE